MAFLLSVMLRSAPGRSARRLISRAICSSSWASRLRPAVALTNPSSSWSILLASYLAQDHRVYGAAGGSGFPHLGTSRDPGDQRLGVSLGGYKFWESRDRTPSAGWILRLQALCPDNEIRARFGLKAEALNPDSAGSSGRKLSEEQEELLRTYNDAATGINILDDVAEAGHHGAAEALRKLADQITKRAGDWRRMKYLKK